MNCMVDETPEYRDEIKKAWDAGLQLEYEDRDGWHPLPPRLYTWAWLASSHMKVRVRSPRGVPVPAEIVVDDGVLSVKDGTPIRDRLRAWQAERGLPDGTVCNVIGHGDLEKLLDEVTFHRSLIHCA